MIGKWSSERRFSVAAEEKENPSVIDNAMRMHNFGTKVVMELILIPAFFDLYLNCMAKSQKNTYNFFKTNLLDLWSSEDSSCSLS